jgi:uncharacterized protein DUF3606
MPNELAKAVEQQQATRINWGNDQELFYWAMKWHVRSEDIKEAAISAGPNIKKIEACLRKKGWLR